MQPFSARAAKALEPLFLLFLLVLLPCLVGTAPAFALDRFELRDGSVVMGTLKDADGGTVTVDTAFAGTLEIDQEQIVAMRVESELTLQMADGSVLESEGLRVSGEQLQLETQAPAGYALSQLTRINPEPWELGNGYRFFGNASMSFASQRGNTNTDQIDYRVESNWESTRDRIRLAAFGEVDEANGVKNAENWTIRGRYDRVQTGDWYWGVGASVEQDLFADLDLRTSIGPYLGRKFFTEPRFSLEAEAGLAYTMEDFVSSEDREYLGATWDIQASSDILGDDRAIYYRQKGIWNLDEIENVVLQNTLGIGFPLWGGFDGAAEVTLDYNSGAVPGTKELDQTYRFRLGYRW